MDFVEVEKKIAAYKGDPVSIVVVGGGQGIAQLTTIPGASKVVNAIFIPYGRMASEFFIGRISEPRAVAYGEKAVCAESARSLRDAALHEWPGNIIACTAATTTSRYRRGLNQAFISTISIDPDDISKIEYNDYHLKLSKLSEEDHKSAGGYISWKRRAEDREITNFILKLIFGE